MKEKNILNDFKGNIFPAMDVIGDNAYEKSLLIPS